MYQTVNMGNSIPWILPKVHVSNFSTCINCTKKDGQTDEIRHEVAYTEANSASKIYF